MSTPYAQAYPTAHDASMVEADYVDDDAVVLAQEGSHLMGLASLAGTKILNFDDEALGTVADLMFDLDSGRVSYVVIKSGGFLGLGEKHFAIPWGVVVIDRVRRCLVVDADAATFAHSPGFDPGNWGDSRPGESSWQDRLHLHWNRDADGNDGPDPRT